MPDRSAAGAFHDEQRALLAAEAWMREHRAAAAARVAPVRLDVMESAYVPAGRPLEAVRHGNNLITWRTATA